MQQIPLTQDPNQEFTLRLDDVRYLLRIKEANGVMVADVTMNDVLVLSATRVLAGEFIIPYARMVTGGNFLVLTNNDELPDYVQFGSSQQLIYMSLAELLAL